MCVCARHMYCHIVNMNDLYLSLQIIWVSIYQTQQSCVTETKSEMAIEQMIKDDWVVIRVARTNQCWFPSRRPDDGQHHGDDLCSQSHDRAMMVDRPREPVRSHQSGAPNFEFGLPSVVVSNFFPFPKWLLLDWNFRCPCWTARRAILKAEATVDVHVLMLLPIEHQWVALPVIFIFFLCNYVRSSKAQSQ